jgi:hypothetical protein
MGVDVTVSVDLGEVALGADGPALERARASGGRW